MVGRRAWALAGAGVLLLGAGWVAQASYRGVRADLQVERDRHGEPVVGSRVCLRCHEDHHASWARTHHARMTQTATPAAVLGDFDDGVLRYRGLTATMTHEGDRYRVRVRDGDELVSDDEVRMTIGSRRIQQYVAERAGPSGPELVRLPVAWHVEEGRWIPMNGAFLTADPEVGPDFERHVTRWNDNCVFCHNVAPNPGLQRDGGFDTEVGELGVACEACHGPGAEHVAHNTNPLRRYVLHHGEDRDPTITNPDRLDARGSSDVCGRCHGQRMADDVGPFLRRGDPFVPGDDLAAYSEPLWRTSTLNGEPLFADRFWPDGTPRLTAYEYQGWLQSPCTEGGELACTTCHGMHGADPAGQIREEAIAHVSGEERLGAGACINCHPGPAEDEHDGHGGQVACPDCHMPRVVYGVIDVHRSHRIAKPDPTGQETGHPAACVLCHLDWNDDWGQRQVFGGDPVERAVAAAAWGRSPTVDPGVARGILLEVMRGDDYPAVRRIAFRALRGRIDPEPAWIAFDPTGEQALRERQVDALAAEGSVQAPDADEVRAWRTQAEDHAIWIGE